MYEEGDGHGPGSDLDALKAYIMMQMMYDPLQDDLALIKNFLNHYYGARAAPFVRLYMDTMHASIADTGYYMREGFDHYAAFLTPVALLTSADALNHALALSSNGSIFHQRVELVMMAIYYPILLRWDEMRSFASNESLTWPLESTKDSALDWFLAVGQRVGVIHLAEAGHDLQWFAQQVRHAQPKGVACGACTISITKELAGHCHFEMGAYGCGDASKSMFVDHGCAGVFTCCGRNVVCISHNTTRTECNCSTPRHYFHERTSSHLNLNL